MNKCLSCGKDVKNKFCNTSCQNKIQSKGRKLSESQTQKMRLTILEKWVEFDVSCYKCGRDIKIREYNVKVPKKDKYFCSRSCANSKVWSDEDKLKKSNSAKKSEKVKKANKLAGEKRVGKKTAERFNVNCPVCSKVVTFLKSKPKKYHAKCWRSISGGFKEGSSRGKSGWYKGYWCDSSWELAWVVYNLEQDIDFERNKFGFEYEFENKKSLFYPDFIVDGEYIEIKNYNSKRLEAKLEYFPHKINVLYKEQLKNAFDYVIDKYGKNYIELYE
jgi:hypothetical protein